MYLTKIIYENLKEFNSLLISKYKLKVKKDKNEEFLNAAFSLVTGCGITTSYTLLQLKEICKSKGLKITGKKEVLLDRINNPDNIQHASKGTRKKKNTKFKGRDVSKIIEKLQGAESSINIQKNSDNHYIDSNTNFVFDPISFKVIGKIVDNKLRCLLPEDIHLCKEMKVKYDIPENLDLGVIKIVDQKVEEVLGEDAFKDEIYDSEEDEEDLS